MGAVTPARISAFLFIRLPPFPVQMPEAARFLSEPSVSYYIIRKDFRQSRRGRITLL